MKRAVVNSRSIVTVVVSGAAAVAATATLAMLPACATLTGGGARFADVKALEASAKIPADASAVVLLLDDTIYVRGSRGTGDPVTELRRHQVVKVLSEAGFAAAKARVFIPKDGELASLAARTISPDGTVTPVAASAMIKTREIVEGSAGGSLRTFQFPKVEVGSVLELIYTTRTTAIFPTMAVEVASPFPIATYKVDVSTPANVTFDFLLNGTTSKLEQVPDPDGRQRVVTSISDIPPLAREPFRPAARNGAPWWIYRITEIRSAKGGNEAILVAWDRGVPFVVGDNVWENKPIPGLPRLASGCDKKDVKCVVEKALDKTREIEWSGFADDGEARDPEDIVPSGTANNFEKALLLWSLLRSDDVTAHVAVLARAPGFPVNKSFPSATWFNHAVVYVPGLAGGGGSGGAGGVFLDPSCEACKIGELPEWDRDVEALVVVPKGNGALNTEWRPLDGEDLGNSGHTITYLAKLAQNGDADVDVEEIAVDEAAAYVRLQTRADDAAAATRAWEAFAQARSRTATVESSTPWNCDRAQGRCKRTAKLKIPGYATPSERSLVVSLELFHSPFEEPGCPASYDEECVAMPADLDPTKRVTPFIDITRSHALTETLRLVPPAGMKIAALPEAVDGKADFGYATMSAVEGSNDGEVVVTRTAALGINSMPKVRFPQVTRLFAPYREARARAVRFVAK